jgi:hypothetical protein
MKKIILFTLAISVFNTMHSATEKLDFKEKFEFLKEEECQTLTGAIKEIKWRIRSGYLAEFNTNITAVRWLVKKLAQNFKVKTTTIATKLDTFACKEYVKFAIQYLEIVKTQGADAAKKFSYLYPEYTADLGRL